MKKFLGLILATALLSAASTSDNKFTIGDGQSSNKQLCMKNSSSANLPCSRYNTSSSLWDFSNDGSIYAPMVGTTLTQTLTNKTMGSTNTLTGATAASFTNSGTVSLPTATTTLVGRDTTDTLTNKTLSGNTATNLVSGSGTFTFNTTGTITAPNATDTLVGKATTDALTNKTLSGNTASSLVNGSGIFNFNSSGTLTAPNATDTLVGRTTTDTLTNKTLGSTNTITGATAASFTNTGTVTLPSSSTTLVGRDTTDTLTSKTIDGDDNTVQDLAGSFTNTGTVTLPTATTTLVGRDTTDTLTNKTLTSPVINSPTGITKGDVGLGNVDNTSDATKNSASVSLTNKTIGSTNTLTGATAGSFTNTGTITLPTATTTLVGRDTTDTLTNKTLTAPIVDQSLYTEASAPSTPASGKLALYSKVDHKLYTKDSTGTETSLGGSGSGSGELNYVFNPNDANAGWTASNTGITVATTSSATDIPLANIVSSAIKITPVSGSDYVYYRWTSSAALKNTKLKVQWDQRPLSGYAAGDLKVEVHTNTASNYAGTDATLPLSTDSSAVSAIPNLTGRYVTTYDADSSDYYELRIKRVSGTTALNITSVIVGPGIQPQGAVVSQTQTTTFTPSATPFGTVTNGTYKYERVGNKMHAMGYFKAGTVTANPMVVTMPTGFTIDTSNSFSATSTAQLGTWYSNPSSATGFGSANIFGVVFFDGSDTSNLYLANSGQSSVLQKSNANNLTSNSGITFDVWIPIAEWAGNGTVAIGQNDVEFAYNTSTSTTTGDTTSFAYGPQGANIQDITVTLNRRVRFKTPIQPGDQLVLQLANTDGLSWVAPGGLINGLNVGNLNIRSGNETGVGFFPVSGSTTDVDVRFGQYANDATTAWTTAATGKWRVAKGKPGQTVGFGAATTTVAGLVKLPSAYSSAYGGNGYGSSNTKVSRFTTQTMVGTDITYTDSSTLGGSWTVNSPGLYSMMWNHRSSLGNTFGIVLNSTTDAGSLTANDTNLLCVSNNPTNGDAACAVTWPLQAGDVIRCTGDASGTLQNSALEMFRMVKVVGF